MSKETSSFQKVAPFMLGGASGMAATVCIQPIDPENRAEPDWRLLEALSPAAS